MTAQFCGQSKTDQSQPKDQSQPDKPLGEVPKMKSILGCTYHVSDG